MFSFLITWLVTAVSLLIADHFLVGMHIDGFRSALTAAVVLGVVNSLIRPLLVLLTLPLTIITLGFFILVINGLTFAIVDYLTPGLHVDSWVDAMVAPLIVSLVAWGINFFLGND